MNPRRQRAPAPGAGKAREPASMARDTLIVIPTLNEHDNIVELLEGVHAHCTDADVLIVDDSAAIRKILQRMLKSAGVAMGRILEAGDGLEALAQLKGQAVQLILSDINMPNMDGIQLLSELKSRVEFRNVPVIMVTTEGGEAKVMEAVQLGASGYVRKPFTGDQIKEKLAGLI